MKRFILFFAIILACGESFAQMSVWNGNNSKWEKGDGSKSNPYLIESADHLAYLAESTSGGVSTFTGKYFELVIDINLNNLEWNSIGCFSGIFDGGNHIIFGLTNALFKEIKEAKIHDIRLAVDVDWDVNTSVNLGYEREGYFGALCCISRKSAIDHCLTKGVVTMHDNDYADKSTIYCAGIVGYSMESTIRDCINDISIATPERDTIDRFGYTINYISISGIIGFAEYGGRIENCANRGDLRPKSEYSSTMARAFAIATFASSRKVTVVHCYNTGNIAADGKSFHNEFSPWSRQVISCYSLNSIRRYTNFEIEEGIFSTDSEINPNCFSLSSTNGVHTKTETAMKGDAFPEILNQGETVFIKDITPNINGGYPIFAYQITEDPTYATIKDGESYKYNNNVYTESGEYYYYEPDDWGAIKHVLYLEVEKKDVIVKIDANDSSMGRTMGSGTYKSNQLITIEAVPNYGYHFVKWSDGNTNPIREITLGKEDIYLTAYFGISQFNISAISNDILLGKIVGGGTFDYKTIVKLEAIPSEYCHFVSWTDGIIENPRMIEVTQDMTIGATFAINQYMIEVVSSNLGGGVVTGSGLYEYGREVIITAVSNDGWYFVCWADGNTDNPRTISVLSNVSFEAVFEQVANGIDDIYKQIDECLKFENGRIVIVRDGIKYNLNGQIIK